MTRRAQRCILWLLPLLILRAFVPVGYMVSAGADGLQLTLCPAQGALPAGAIAPDAVHEVSTAVVAQHAGHHMPHGAAPAHSSLHDGKQLDSPCPYAAASVAVAYGLPLAHQLPALVDDVVPESLASPLSAGPLRIDRIRGPPRFS